MIAKVRQSRQLDCELISSGFKAQRAVRDFVRKMGSAQESGKVANWRGFERFGPGRLVVEVGLPGRKLESSGDERTEMVWKSGRAWDGPARSVVSTPWRRC